MPETRAERLTRVLRKRTAAWLKQKRAYEWRKHRTALLLKRYHESRTAAALAKFRTSRRLARESRARTLELKHSMNVQQERVDNATRKPRIIDPGLDVVNKFGALGQEFYVTGHHSAGPTDKGLEDAIRLCRVYHYGHATKGWGGIGYHYNLARSGEIILLRPLRLKGAHVGGNNSHNVGILCHGTTGDRPTAAQERAYKWLLANAHTKAMPLSHRTDRDLRDAARNGHNDWPGHSANQCPGTHKPMYVG